MLFGIFQIFLEFLVELAQGVGPRLLTLFNLVKFFFQMRRILHIENIAEVFHQQISHDQPNFSRREFSPDLLHVLPFLNGRQDRGIGGRPANAALFQLFHQRRLVVAWRRLSEMLLRLQFLERKFLSGFERWQFVFQFFVFLVLAFLRLFINAQESVELKHRPGYAEPENFVAIFRVDVDRSLVKDCRIDLRSHKTLPDQLVDLELIFF